MPPNVIKYPRTEHLVNPGGNATTEDDLVVSDLASVCRVLSSDPCRPVILEEKIDGANLGVRIVNSEILVQNRNHWISSGEHAQFSMIQPWIEEKREELVRLLGCERLILYGEWCAAKHSIRYDKLPGSYFLAFDLFDIEANRFYSRQRFHNTMQGSGIPVVPTIGVLPTTCAKGPGKNKIRQRQNNQENFLIQTILKLLDTTSRFRLDQGPVEGVMLRQDNRAWMEHRFKVVRPDFVRGCAGGHWTRRPIEKQVVDYMFAQRYLDECYVFANEWQPAAGPKNFFSSSDLIVDASKTNAKEDERILLSRRRRIPRCIMLMGLPASGKSSFAAALASALNESTSRSMPTLVANQDDLGRKECARVASRASSKCRVIVDRCNLTVGERKEFFECMHSPPMSDLVLVHFAASDETCTTRAKLRIGHQTIAPGKGCPELVSQLEKRLEIPTDHERTKVFGRVETVRTWEEASSLLRKWGVRMQ